MECHICGGVGETWEKVGIWNVTVPCPREGCNPKHRPIPKEPLGCPTCNRPFIIENDYFEAFVEFTRSYASLD
jgi:hypothetical protein